MVVAKQFTTSKLVDAGSAALAAELAPYVGEAIRFGGDVLGSYFSGVGRVAKEETLKGLTETRTPKDAAGRSVNPRSRAAYRDAIGDAYKNPEDKWEARFPKEKGSYPEWAGFVYKNPETTAEVVSRAAPAAGLLAGAGALNWLAESGGSPRSDYSLPVDPNPNVTAANVSYQNQSALEEQKFRHHMALQQARAQSRIPGPQDTSSGSYGGGPYGSSEALNIVKGIYG
jgi:hypothetical protein